MEEKKSVKCSHCGYEWETKTVLIMITCPSCQKKFKLIEEKKEEVKA